MTVSLSRYETTCNYNSQRVSRFKIHLANIPRQPHVSNSYSDYLNDAKTWPNWWSLLFTSGHGWQHLRQVLPASSTTNLSTCFFFFLTVLRAPQYVPKERARFSHGTKSLSVCPRAALKLRSRLEKAATAAAAVHWPAYFPIRPPICCYPYSREIGVSVPPYPSPAGCQCFATGSKQCVTQHAFDKCMHAEGVFFLQTTSPCCKFVLQNRDPP